MKFCLMNSMHLWSSVLDSIYNHVHACHIRTLTWKCMLKVFVFSLKLKWLVSRKTIPAVSKKTCIVFYVKKEGSIKKDTQKQIMKCPVMKKQVTNQENIKNKNLKHDILTEQTNLVKQFRLNYKNREILMHEVKKN